MMTSLWIRFPSPTWVFLPPLVLVPQAAGNGTWLSIGARQRIMIGAPISTRIAAL